MSCIHCNHSDETCSLMDDWDEDKASPVAVVGKNSCGVELEEYSEEDCDYFEDEL